MPFDGDLSKDDAFRNRALTDLAKGKSCQVRGPGCWWIERGDQETTVSAHSNQARHGKGMSRKAHDCFIAWACYHCHAAIDQGGALTREERRELWQQAHERTLLEMFRQGLIVVKGKR
jgi:hypothetical protein